MWISRITPQAARNHNYWCCAECHSNDYQQQQRDHPSPQYALCRTKRQDISFHAKPPMRICLTNNRALLKLAERLWIVVFTAHRGQLSIRKMPQTILRSCMICHYYLGSNQSHYPVGGLLCGPSSSQPRARSTTPHSIFLRFSSPSLCQPHVSRLSFNMRSRQTP